MRMLGPYKNRVGVNEIPKSIIGCCNKVTQAMYRVGKLIVHCFQRSSPIVFIFPRYLQEMLIN